jgi:PhoH-like ATPase
MKKNYHLDTCTLLDQDNTIEILRNGEENNIFVSMTVINELDHLLKSKKRHLAMNALDSLIEHKGSICFIDDTSEQNNDDQILKSVINCPSDEKTLVTNDKLLRLKAYIKGIASQEFKITNPFKNESEKYTGIVNAEEPNHPANSFYFKEGKLFHNHNGNIKLISYNNSVWNVSPKTIYQNAAMELLINDDIPLVTIQSNSGFGKSFISLAAALKLVFETKKYSKIYIVRYPSEIGEDLGFLPGKIDEKMALHWKPLYKLLIKLHKSRNFSKGFLDEKTPDGWPILNPQKIEFLPVNYLRGENLEDCVVIIDEGQNFTRNDMRTVLTRMCENVKCIITGDISQIDNPKCDVNNNALNWLVKIFKGNNKYGHIMLKGNSTRGDITKMILDSGY